MQRAFYSFLSLFVHYEAIYVGFLFFLHILSLFKLLFFICSDYQPPLLLFRLWKNDFIAIVISVLNFGSSK